MTRLSRFLRAAPAFDALRSSVAGIGPRFALASLLAVGWAGCLVPQSIDKSSDSPHSPPRIVIESFTLDQYVPWLTLTRVPRDVGCTCQIELDVPVVEEEDPTVTLQARWFIDYDVRDPSKQNFASLKDLGGSFDFSLTRRIGPTFSADGDALGDGFHSVEAVIADRNAYLDPTDQASKLPWRSLRGDYQAATYRFVVQVKTDPDATSCADQGIYHRNCHLGNP
jgi:hypothetical protein